MSATYISSVFFSGSPRNEAGPVTDSTAPIFTSASAPPVATRAARPSAVATARPATVLAIVSSWHYRFLQAGRSYHGTRVCAGTCPTEGNAGSRQMPPRGSGATLVLAREPPVRRHDVRRGARGEPADHGGELRAVDRRADRLLHARGLGLVVL